MGLTKRLYQEIKSDEELSEEEITYLKQKEEELLYEEYFLNKKKNENLDNMDIS
jgi:hypothetical protein